MYCPECGLEMRLTQAAADTSTQTVDVKWSWTCGRGHSSTDGIETCDVCGRQCLNRKFEPGKSAIPIQLSVGCTECVTCNICGEPLGTLPRTFNADPQNSGGEGSDWSHIGCIARQRAALRRANQPYQPSLGDVAQVTSLVETRASTILTLGILSLFCCGVILGPIAWVMASTDLYRIDSGQALDKDRSVIVAGQTLGIIGTILSITGLLVYMARHSSGY